jgi:hypothetical protein
MHCVRNLALRSLRGVASQ